MRAAQRRWESAMDVQLQRLRKAAHEAEERNAVAAAAADAAGCPRVWRPPAGADDSAQVC